MRALRQRKLPPKAGVREFCDDRGKASKLRLGNERPQPPAWLKGTGGTGALSVVEVISLKSRARTWVEAVVEDNMASSRPTVIFPGQVT